MAKTWEKTVMSDEQIESKVEEFCSYLEGHRQALKQVAQAQAEISYKAGYNAAADKGLEACGKCEARQEGIRKVVEFADSECPHSHFRNARRFCDRCWENFKKENGL